MKKVQRPVGFCKFYNKYSTYPQKLLYEVLHTNYTGYVKIKAYFKIKPERR
jgi:hypothetical protein